MIKYVEYDSIDETGQHIISVNSLYHMNKTASGSYSPEIMKVILNMKRKPNLYYVVINAVGSMEIWGANRNADDFPKVGISHKSLRTDMATVNDYGYKTFEYYAKLYKQHINKDPKKSFGDVIFSHWNPVIERVELIVGIDKDKNPKMIEAIENGDNVSVSMGCLTNPDYPILTIDGYKPIKDIKVGDLVFTHKNRWRKVTDLHRRKYTGKLYNIKTKGLPIPLELTSEHPVLSKSFQKETLGKTRAYIAPEEFEKKEFDWSNAENIEIGDHIKYSPAVYSEFGLCKIDDKDLAKLMGYYTAEGSFIYNKDNPCTIQLSCNTDDDLLKEVPILVNKIFNNISCSIYPHSISDRCFSVNINSTEVAKFFHKYLGHRVREKFIPKEIFVSNKDVKLSYLGAWLSGDGWCDAKGVHWSSCNVNLILQARDLLMSCGIPSSIYKICHKPGLGFNFHETIEYTLNISHLDAEPLIEYSVSKLKNLKDIISNRKKDGNSAIRINNDGSLSYSVKEVEIRDGEDIQTYNFSVEEDESYIAAGLTIHNCKVRYDRCSICENKAKTKKEYCKHLKNYLGQIVDRELAALWSRELGRTILPGIQVTAHNDHPRFFDISEVYIGADRTSYVLGKAASLENVISSIDIAEVNGITDEHINKLAMVGKQGEIEKEIGGALGPTDIDGAVVDSSENIVLKKALNENINKTIAAEPILPKDFLNSMSTLPIETIFSTMLGMGIYPKPAEVQRIIIVKSGHPGIADQLEDNNEIFDYEDDSCPCQMKISNDYFSNTLGKLLVPYLEKRSCFPYYLKKRIEESLEKTAYYSSTEPGKDYWLESGPGTGPGIRHSDISPATKALGGLAAIYAGLKLKSMGYGPKRMAEIFTTKPWLRMLLSGGVFWKLQDMINQSDENDPIMRSASDYSGVLQDSNFSGHIKQSNFNDLVKLGEFGEAIILPCSYIANAAEQKALITERKHIISGSDDYLSKIASAAIEKNYLLTQRDIDLVNCGIQKILQRIG